MPSESLPVDDLSVTSFTLDGQTCSIFTPESNLRVAKDQFSWPEIVRDLIAGEGLEQSETQAGRGGIFYLSGKHLPQSVVVRQYRHGGMWRFFSRARFFSQDRFLTEFKIHRQAARLGVPVPEAVAVIVLKKNRWTVFVSGYFVTLRLQNSLTLSEFLASVDAGTRLRIFSKLGGYLQKLHEHGIFYTDMHVKNILVTADGEPWLIDFDKAKKLKAPLSFRYRLANLKRFRRSLEKYRSRGGCLTESDQSAFLLAYAPDSKVYAEFFQKLSRGLFWRRFLYRLGWLINRS